MRCIFLGDISTGSRTTDKTLGRPLPFPPALDASGERLTLEYAIFDAANQSDEVDGFSFQFSQPDAELERLVLRGENFS